MALWLSELGRPVEHCHNSRELLGIITGSDNDPKVLGETWLQCEWWDDLLPRPRLNEESRLKFQTWIKQTEGLQKLERILPPIEHPILIVQDKTDPFAYSISERKLVLGEEVLKTNPLLIRAVLQAWLYQVDRQGLDSFQVETLADFLMVSLLGIESYKHPVTGFDVSLVQKRFWPEDAMDFKDYCFGEEASLQHLALCRDLNSQLQLSAGSQNPSLWSSRLYLLSRLIEGWKSLDQTQSWQNLSRLAARLESKNIHPLSSLAAQKPVQSIRQLMDEEVKPLTRLLGLTLPAPKEIITHLIDWQAGDLSEDFLMSLSPDEITASDRVLLRYKNKFWDVKKTA